MNIGMLEHVNLRTHRLAEMVAWYDRVLGMKAGWRPTFPFGGAWLYSGDNKPTVHLVEVDAEPPSGLKLEHFAFSATGLVELVARLKALGVVYEILRVEGVNVQVNVYDPDGNHIHIDFPFHEADALAPGEVKLFTGLPQAPMAQPAM